MKCGDRGHVTLAGEPCPAPIGAKAAGCVFHTRDAAAIATKGALASRLRRHLPADTPRPEFADTGSIVTWAQDTAHKVLTGDLDPRAAAEARQLASLTIAARAADAQERLVEILASLEHGGAAVAFLARLQSGLAEGKRRPLPGRVLQMTPPDGDAS